jgi:hypothetical protein
VGDKVGGSGWHVELPDGSSTRYYVQLPPTVDVQWTLHLPDSPREHRGQPLHDTSIQSLAQLYIAYLEELVSEARAKFSP